MFDDGQFIAFETEECDHLSDGGDVCTTIALSRFIWMARRACLTVAMCDCLQTVEELPSHIADLI